MMFYIFFPLSVLPITFVVIVIIINVLKTYQYCLLKDILSVEFVLNK